MALSPIQLRDLSNQLNDLSAQVALGGGLKNYIANPKFADVTLGVPTSWSVFKTTLTNQIPTGSIGAADAGFSIAQTGTTPLEGSFSGLLASTGVLAIGNGLISAPFTIDREDRAKVMGFSFAYEAVSGTMNFSGTSANTWAVYIYDVSGSAWIQPAGVYNLVQGSGVGIASGTFQTTATGTQYRIALVCVTATSGAVSLEVDDFQLGPQKVLAGAAVSDWQLYTPTISNATGISSLVGYYRRIGDTLQVRASFVVDNIARSGTSQWRVSIPQNYSPNLSLVTDNGGTGVHGVYELYGDITGTTNQFVQTDVARVDGGGIALARRGSNRTLYDADFNSIGNAKYISIDIQFPIQGWSSNTVMSQDTDTRVVAMAATTATGTITGSPSDITWSTISKDTHSAFNGVTYTVPVSGYYQISAQVRIAATYVAGNAVGIALNVNSSNVMYGLARAGGAQVDVSPTLTTIRYLNAGDLVKIQVDSAGTSPSFSGGGTYNYLSLNRLSGPATIAASESVVASAQRSTADGAQTYSTSPGQTFRCFTDYFPTDNVDTHGILTNTASETYATIPVSGVYEISRMCRYVASSTTLVVQNYILLGGTNQTNAASLDGVSLAASISNTVTASDGSTISVSYVGRLNAGDIIRFKCLKYGDTNMTMLGGGTSQISIKKVGN